MPEEIDYLNDALLQTPEPAATADRTPLVDRAREVLDRVAAFRGEVGREPVSEPGRSVRERMLANELAGLRASQSELADLASYDITGLVFSSSAFGDPLSDALLSDDLDIFDVRDELKPIARPDFIADRRPCPDFVRFEPMFEGIRRAVADGSRKPQPFRQERVDLGESFVLRGQLVHVADIGDEHERNGRSDARLRVVFDNGTESNLLMSSLVRRLYEDKDAKRIGRADAGPLFDGVRTGFVYVLRSLSDRPEPRGLLKVGTTSGQVEDRIANAARQPTFLFAPVEIVETYELFGHSATEAERRLHRALQPHHVVLKVIGPDGRRFTATEWFRASPELVGDAVRVALS